MGDAPCRNGQHATGDELLVAGAARLVSDELVLFLCHTSTDHGADIGGRALATLVWPISIASAAVTITGSAGATASPRTALVSGRSTTLCIRLSSEAALPSTPGAPRAAGAASAR